MNLESVQTGLSQFFFAPEVPRRAISFSAEAIVAVSAARKGSRLVLQRNAAETLPEGLIVPSFEGPNVKDPHRLSALVTQLIERAGLMRERRWSVALPRHSARLIILPLDEVPSKRKELVEVLEFKVERMLEIPAADLTISFKRLKNVPGETRFLAAAVRNEVLAVYEEAVRSSRRQPGLVVPGQWAEAAWLFMSKAPSDSLLMAIQGNELQVIFARGGELLSMRTTEITLDGLADEVHRSLAHYQDKLVVAGAKLDLILLSGQDLIPAQVIAICEELFEAGARPQVQSLSDQQVDGQEGLPIDRISSALGLAALGAA